MAAEEEVEENMQHNKQISILLIGASCSGKGFVTDIIKNKYPYAISISVGDLLREAAKEDAFIAEIIKQSKGIPDDVIIELCKKHIPQNERLVIVDNSVRTIKQIDTVKNLPNLNIIYLDVIDEELIRRAVTRARVDDVNIQGRLDDFKKDTLPAVEELKKIYPNNFYTFKSGIDDVAVLENILEKIYGA